MGYLLYVWVWPYHIRMVIITVLIFGAMDVMHHQMYLMMMIIMISDLFGKWVYARSSFNPACPRSVVYT